MLAAEALSLIEENENNLNQNIMHVSQMFTFNPIQDGHFRGYSRMDGGGEAKRPFLPKIPKICHRYLTMIELAQVIPYLRKIKQTYKSRDTLLDVC